MCLGIVIKLDILRDMATPESFLESFPSTTVQPAVEFIVFKGHLLYLKIS